MTCLRTASADEAQKPTPAEQALALHDEALELYDRGEYRAAIQRLQDALELDPKGKELVYNLALIHERLAEVDTAERYYRRYLEMERDPKLRARVEATLRRIEGARKDFAPPPPPKKQKAPPPQPPPLPRVEARAPLSPWFYASSGVAAGSLLAGVVLGISAVAGDPGADATTGQGVGVDDLRAAANAAHTRAVIADVFFASSALMTGVAIYLYSRSSNTTNTTQPLPSASTRPPSVSLGLAFGRAGVRVLF